MKISSSTARDSNKDSFKSCFRFSLRNNLRSWFSGVKGGILSVFTANVVNKIIGFLSTMVVTRVLTTTDYGIWGYTLNIYSYLGLISGLGLMSGSGQFGTEHKGEGRAYSYFRYCISRGLVINTGIVIISSIILCVITLPINEAKQFILLYMPNLLLDYIFAITQGILRSKNRIKEFARLTNINSFFTAVGVCGGVFWGITGLIIGKYIASLVAIAYASVKLRDTAVAIRKAEGLSKTEKKALWHYSIIIGMCAAMNVLIYQLDITLIAAMIRSATDVAVYKVGTLIPNALQFIPGSVVTAILPNIIYHKDDISWIRSSLKRVYLYLTLLNAFLTVTLFIFAPLAIRFFSGARYLVAVPVFRVLIFGYFFSGTFWLLSVNLLASFRRMRYSFFISITSCVTNIFFNYFLILKYQMIGAAYATLLVDIITATMSFSYLMFLIKRGTINEVMAIMQKSN